MGACASRPITLEEFPSTESIPSHAVQVLSDGHAASASLGSKDARHVTPSKPVFKRLSESITSAAYSINVEELNDRGEAGRRAKQVLDGKTGTDSATEKCAGASFSLVDSSKPTGSNMLRLGSILRQPSLNPSASRASIFTNSGNFTGEFESSLGGRMEMPADLVSKILCTDESPDRHVLEMLEHDLCNLSPIGKGGGGVVYRAEWRGAKVAVKLIVSDTPERLQDSVLEAITGRMLAHPHVVLTYATKVIPIESTWLQEHSKMELPRHLQQDKSEVDREVERLLSGLGSDGYASEGAMDALQESGFRNQSHSSASTVPEWLSSASTQSASNIIPTTAQDISSSYAGISASNLQLSHATAICSSVVSGHASTLSPLSPHINWPYVFDLPTPDLLPSNQSQSNNRQSSRHASFLHSPLGIRPLLANAASGSRMKKRPESSSYHGTRTDTPCTEHSDAAILSSPLISPARVFPLDHKPWSMIKPLNSSMSVRSLVLKRSTSLDLKEHDEQGSMISSIALRHDQGQNPEAMTPSLSMDSPTLKLHRLESSTSAASACAPAATSSPSNCAGDPERSVTDLQAEGETTSQLLNHSSERSVTDLQAEGETTSQLLNHPSENILHLDGCSMVDLTNFRPVSIVPEPSVHTPGVESKLVGGGGRGRQDPLISWQAKSIMTLDQGSFNATTDDSVHTLNISQLVQPTVQVQQVSSVSHEDPLIAWQARPALYYPSPQAGPPLHYPHPSIMAWQTSGLSPPSATDSLLGLAPVMMSSDQTSAGLSTEAVAAQLRAQSLSYLHHQVSDSSEVARMYCESSPHALTSPSYSHSFSRQQSSSPRLSGSATTIAVLPLTAATPQSTLSSADVVLPGHHVDAGLSPLSPHLAAQPLISKSVVTVAGSSTSSLSPSVVFSDQAAELNAWMKKSPSNTGWQLPQSADSLSGAAAAAALSVAGVQKLPATSQASVAEVSVCGRRDNKDTSTSRDEISKYLVRRDSEGSFDFSFGNSFSGQPSISFDAAMHRLDLKAGQYVTCIVMEYCDRGSLVGSVGQGIFVSSSRRWGKTTGMRALVRTCKEIAQVIRFLQQASLFKSCFLLGRVL
ncbi:hypothetical protein CEUSTIGMA_g6442.t1 [Chlamydomonas eustigma]|uniref:Protein kinase domain-containing protein n=1 Tax=Chlamydomonas eustigma TaxID=1157962 RepID=A0A250X7Z4_9CHLO|nr:hypothetical protein CEUSTIGMA_g6442.t1 [Chlamydomonas eustigma]|eukprot:GAX79002.1 hypothetical protein CEUSTIGMA_g6442.t1 [Chlamydomonas eustigma]